MRIIKKPDDKEFQANEPLLAKLVPDDGLLLKHLMANLETTKAFILSLPKGKLMYRYIIVLSWVFTQSQKRSRTRW